MQSMSWMIARLGSRFGFFFEPHKRAVRHSALGRFLDQPLDLAVGLVEPDGTERVLPFTQSGQLLYCPEQFERLNSITFRGHSEGFGLRFEFNIHSVFYPRDERVCLMPAFYMELRVSPVDSVRGLPRKGETPTATRLFLRINRPDTTVQASVGPAFDGASATDSGRIDLSYRAAISDAPGARSVEVRERIVSLNPGCVADERGLSLELPVTEANSGIKWRLVWSAYCGDPVLEREGESPAGAFRYTKFWPSLDAVVAEAISTRDDSLSHSRRIERAVEQAPLRMPERHMVNLGVQTIFANTFWVDFDNKNEPSGWLGVWDGNSRRFASLPVLETLFSFYASFWPSLLGMQLDHWTKAVRTHTASGGVYPWLSLGQGAQLFSKADPAVERAPATIGHAVSQASAFLLLLQGYVRFQGAKELAERNAKLIEGLGKFLAWADREGTGFVVGDTPLGTGGKRRDSRTEGVDIKYTPLAIRRVSALLAAADLLSIAGKTDLVSSFESTAKESAKKIEEAAWSGDHYAATVSLAISEEMSAASGAQGSEVYSIRTTRALLVPAIVERELPFEKQRLIQDITAASRENNVPYGTSDETNTPDRISVARNIARDMLARYLGMVFVYGAPQYWDLQTSCNTGELSLGATDEYIAGNVSCDPRIASIIGVLLSYPRITVDRLAAGGERITVAPDLHHPQRWPLLPLIDWKAGRIPVCVVSSAGVVSIEGNIDPVVIRSVEQPPRKALYEKR